MNPDEKISIDDMMNQINWNEIGISDDFMFGKVMQNPRLCRKLLETILGIEIEKIEYPERQKVIDIAKESRGIRLDVYVAGKRTDDGFVREVDEEVKRVRESKEWRRDYMTLLMRDREKYEQGREEGRMEGRMEGRTEGRMEGKLEIVIQLIRNGLLTVKDGAEQLHMSETDIAKYL